MCAAAQVVGHLRADVARDLGLTEEVAVAPGSGDNQMSALGAGAVKEGAWVVSLGTSGVSLWLEQDTVHEALQRGCTLEQCPNPPYFDAKCAPSGRALRACFLQFAGPRVCLPVSSGSRKEGLLLFRTSHNT